MEVVEKLEDKVLEDPNRNKKKKKGKVNKETMSKEEHKKSENDKIVDTTNGSDSHGFDLD